MVHGVVREGDLKAAFERSFRSCAWGGEGSVPGRGALRSSHLQAFRNLQDGQRAGERPVGDNGRGDSRWKWAGKHASLDFLFLLLLLAYRSHHDCWVGEWVDGWMMVDGRMDG